MRRKDNGRCWSAACSHEHVAAEGAQDGRPPSEAMPGTFPQTDRTREVSFLLDGKGHCEPTSVFSSTDRGCLEPRHLVNAAAAGRAAERETLQPEEPACRCTGEERAKMAAGWMSRPLTGTGLAGVSCVPANDGGVRLNPNCLENCLLSCYWGCTVQGFQKALSDHEQKFRISTPQQFEEAVLSDFQHSTTFFIEKGNITEIVCKLPEGSSIKDFGTLPRARYPLVALLSLAEPEDREIYSIVASVSVIHASDEKYKMTSRILYQYLLTAQGNVFDLKQLFMSADNPISALNSELVSQDDEEKKQEENEAEMASMLPDSCYVSGVTETIEENFLESGFGFGIPGILQSFEDSESSLQIPERRMMRVKNPFALELNSTTSSYSEILCQLPGDSSAQDAGSLSTARYPFVALLTLEQPDKRELYEIVASVSVIHISHENFRLPSRLLYQYLLTVQGHVYDLKLFMSANHRSRAEDSDLFCKGKEQKQEGDERATTATAASSSEEEGSVRGDRDCVVCQNAPVNQVLLPCRHTCLCDSCVERFHQCPVCRANVWESFALYQKTLHYGDRA
ncbi:CGRF1 protein, partial [Polypterus senegalus]